MKNGRLLIVVAAGALLAAAGCETAAKLPPPKATLTLTLDPDDHQALQALDVGSAVKIVLPPTPPGTNWEIIANDIKTLVPIEDLKPISGGAGGAEATFQAVRARRVIIRFAAVQSGQASATPQDLYQVTVGVKPLQ